MYKCMHGLNPLYLIELFASEYTRFDFHDSNRLRQPEFQNITDWFVSGKCDVFIIQWYTCYIALYMEYIALSYVFIYSSIYLHFTCHQLSNGSLSSILFLNRLAC